MRFGTPPRHAREVDGAAFARAKISVPAPRAVGRGAARTAHRRVDSGHHRDWQQADRLFGPGRSSVHGSTPSGGWFRRCSLAGSRGGRVFAAPRDLSHTHGLRLGGDGIPMGGSIVDANGLREG